MAAITDPEPAPSRGAAAPDRHDGRNESGLAHCSVGGSLFSTPDGAPGTGTRQYHTPGDTLLDEDHDTGFAATIARSVTASALTFAGL